MTNSTAKLLNNIKHIGYHTVVCCFLHSLILGFMPGSTQAQFGNLDADTRTVPWSSITRLALDGGFFPPAYRPVTEEELARLLADTREQALAGQAPSLMDENEYSRLLFLQERYGKGGGGITFNGCSCKSNPPYLRISGRIIGGYSELGDTVPFEGGLSFAAGNNIFFEPSAEFAAGSFWSVINIRLGGRFSEGGIDFDWPDGSSDPLTWPNWSLPTGRFEVRNARLKGSDWANQITRALIGAQLGNWSISAGWDQRRTGPGLTGGLNLDYQGRPFPAITVRRTRSFQWAGFMTHLAPDNMLLRAGLLSERTVSWSDIYGRYHKQAQPYFFQWLLGWNVTSWFRTHLIHTVMATAREGTLCPDLLQINFPLIGTTWREMDSGPITDRIFAVQFEFRWRNAPWPLLPSHAGRLFWDYGGTDFLPSGPGGLIPQISIPASIAGFELFSPRWDLGFEYAELQHTKGLWYSNSGFSEGYSQDQWLIGHPLGGSGESFTSLIRVRPYRWAMQAELQGKLARWGMKYRTPGTGERLSLALTVARTPRHKTGTGDTPASPLLWEITAEWNREKADPYAYSDFPKAASQVERNWWRLIFKIGI